MRIAITGDRRRLYMNFSLVIDMRKLEDKTFLWPKLHDKFCVPCDRFPLVIKETFLAKIYIEKDSRDTAQIYLLKMYTVPLKIHNFLPLPLLRQLEYWPPKFHLGIFERCRLLVCKSHFWRSAKLIKLFPSIL